MKKVSPGKQSNISSLIARCPICDDTLNMPVNVYETARKQHKRRAGYCGNCGRVFSKEEIIWSKN